jgi:hypothetical protein
MIKGGFKGCVCVCHQICHGSFKLFWWPNALLRHFHSVFPLFWQLHVCLSFFYWSLCLESSELEFAFFSSVVCVSVSVCVCVYMYIYIYIYIYIYYICDVLK